MKLTGFFSRDRLAAALTAGFLSVVNHSALGASHTVNIVGDSFSPATLTISAGDSVSWSGLGGAHNVTGSNAGDLDQFCGSGGFGTETSCSHTFTTAGTFPYECTIHASCCGMIGSITVNAAAPPPTPTVSISSPASGATFNAPASVQIMASASVSSGTVTNVAFFSNGSFVGSATSAPFNVTAANLSAGSYNLTAVATAAGISATSAVVGITVASAAPAPTVAITSPAGGAVYPEPGSFPINADASVSSGTVTNVSFFANSILIASAVSAPFTATTSGLSSGPYVLTAVATAGGISTTSAPVTVEVVTQVPVSISNQAANAGQFSFNYTGSPGLNYLVQRSPDLLTWTTLATNNLASSPASFSDPLQTNGAFYYRVVFQPNP